MSHADGDTPFIAAAFLRQYLADREGTRDRSLADYQRQFAGHDALIAREYHDLQEAGARPSAVDQGLPGVAALPAVMGPYRIEAELGRGGQAIVYLARDTRLQREVALKVLTGLESAPADILERFRREAEITSRLDHPGICTVYEAGWSGNTPFIAMRLVKGDLLARRIARDRESRRAADLAHGGTATTSRPKAEVDEILTLFEEAARALHAAHEAGILHRDVKPANIMVTPEGRPVLLDFGLARALDGDLRTLTRTGDFFGTPAYMAPEQLSGNGARVDRRADVWALGVSLYECLFTRRPFDAPTRDGLYQAINHGEPTNPRRLDPSVSRDLQSVLDTALEKNPGRRYSTALALAEDLKALRERRPVSARPTTTVIRALRWAGRRPAHAALVVLLALGVPAIASLGGFILANLGDLQQQQVEKRRAECERLLDEGFEQLHNFDFSGARSTLRSALVLDPASVEAIGGVALAHLHDEEPERALAVLDERAAMPADHPTLGQVRADALRRMGRLPDADALERRLPKPTKAEDHFLAAARAVLRMDHLGYEHDRSALDHIERAMLLYPHGPRYLYYLEQVVAAGHAGDQDVATRTAAALAELWPDAADFGRAHATWNDAEQAIRYFRQSIERRPTLHARMNLGDWLQAAGRTEEALEQFEQANRENPKAAAPDMAVAELMRAQGRLDVALTAARRAVVRNRLDPRIHLLVGKLALALGDVVAARTALSVAVDLQPDNARILNEVAWALVEKDALQASDYAFALRVAQKAVDLSKGRNLEHQDTLAEALFRNGRSEEAAALEATVLQQVRERKLTSPGVEVVEARLRRYRAASQPSR